MSSHRLPYRPDWDGLRAVAILCVLFCHADLSLAGGFIGVDVFFVLSGFLICKLILKDLEQGSFSFALFWERRLRRILPALMVVILSTIIGGSILMSPDACYALGQSAMAATAMGSNVYFWWDTGYFAEDAGFKPLLHTWSLGIEEQFYFFIALGFLILVRFGGLKQSGWWLGAISLCSLILSIAGASQGFSSAFFLLPGRFWELGAGGLLSMIAPTRLPRFLRETMGLAGLGILLFCALIYDGTIHFPGWAAFPPVLGTLLLLWPNSEGANASLVHRLLSVPVLVFLGKISYPLYLWHWPLLVFLNYRSFDPPGTLSRIGILLLGLVLSILTYYLVEAPFRKRILFTQPSVLIRFSAVMSLLVLLVGCFLVVDARAKMDEPMGMDLILATTKRDERYLPNHGFVTEIESLPKFGAKDAQPTILVWGDSHAMAILPAIESMCDINHTAALAATRFLTPPLGGYHASADDHFCEMVLQYLEKYPIHIVILAGHWSCYLEKESQYESLLQTVDKLHSLGIRVFFLKDVPEFDYHVPRIMTMNTTRKFEIHRLGVTRSKYEMTNSFHEEVLPALVKRGVGILDPVRFFESDSDPDLFLPFDGTGVFYRDADHLSIHGALAIKEVFAPVFDELASNKGEPHIPSGDGKITPIITVD